MNANATHYYIFPLQDEDRDNPPLLSQVGGKAQSLIETSTAGFNVPHGLVLTTEFFAPWLEMVQKRSEWKAILKASDNVTKEQCDTLKTACKKRLRLTRAQQTLLDEALARAFGSSKELGLLMAVRSSSPEEDLAGTSFAGGYDTTLGATLATLHNAIITSFCSMLDYRIVSYKLQHSMDISKPQIAIIVQEQIASDVSGVGFSLNPNNNCYDEIVISANFGIGESVVGGIVTPDTYIVDHCDYSILSKQVSNKKESVRLNEGGGTRQETNEHADDPALSDEQIVQVAQLTDRVEAFKGGTFMDIEWAYADGQLYLLQARPVTAYIPLFPELVTKRGDPKFLFMDIMIMTQGFSEPLSVLGLEIWKEMLKKVKPHFAAEGKEGMVWNIHGREYIHLSNLMTTMAGNKMVNTTFRHYDPAIARALDSINLDDYVPDKTPAGAKGLTWTLVKHVACMIPNVVYPLFYGAEDAMKPYIDFAQEFMDDCRDEEYMKDETIATVMYAMMDRMEKVPSKIGGLLTALLSRWRLNRLFLGQQGAEDLLISLCMDLESNPTSEMGHKMVRLAAFPEIRDTNTGEEFVTKLRNGDFSSDFLSEYEDYMKQFGCRGMREIDAASPRTYEREEDFFQRLKQIDVEKNAINNVTERRRDAYQKLLAMSREMGKESTFTHHASIIQRLLGYREHPKYMIVVMVDMLRRRALKIAEQFVQQGRLENKDQIFYLTAEQISEAQTDPNLKVIDLVHANLKPYKKVARITRWPLLIDSRGKIIREDRRKQNLDDDMLVGDSVSPGVVTGSVKVLHEPYEKPLLSGEILVARFTEPSWTPIFINAAGVIMEVGGPLQHGAIIAREYGIPCVSGLDDATVLLKDGDMIELDGSSGTVKLLEKRA